MRLKSIRIVNYKGFDDSGVVPLGQHWTVVVGRNNAGKSAFLEAFAFNAFSNKPHRNIQQDPRLPRNDTSELELSLEISAKELEQAFLASGAADLWVPVPKPNSVFFNETFLGKHLCFPIRKRGGGGWDGPYPSHGLFKDHGNQTFSQQIKRSADQQSWRILEAHSNRNDTVASVAGAAVSASAYVFHAERRVSGRSAFQEDLQLRPDAANLAGALHYLFNSNHVQFQRFLALVRQVLPEIQAIMIPPQGGQVEIRVWSSGYLQERSDLGIPLAECGTGIGQVLAILFVLVTADSGRVLIIDEPNSFLHPGASRMLMQLLRSNDKHQFIITTHSPELIAATEPDELLLIKWEQNASRVTAYNGNVVNGIRAAFDEMGVRLSDVFGLDAIAWVEGKTEEKCFPKLLNAAGRELPPRTAFVSVVNTGDFDGLNAEIVWRTYKQLATQSALAPSAVSISLDTENRSEAVRADLIARSKGLIHFLPRRTYENYLLHSQAIAAVLSDQSDDLALSGDDVEKWMASHRYGSKYYHGVTQPKENDAGAWLNTIDASRFLHDLVGDLTAHKQDFASHKVQYSLAITDWLLVNDKEYLAELIAYVSNLVPNAPR